MSSISMLWNQVHKMAIDSGMPDKPRAILREYLQIKAIDFLYSQKGSEKLSFIGGTSLRLLRGLPRFSEDLDFDNLGITDQEVISLVSQVVKRFESENIPVHLFQKITEGKTYFELRFPDLLKELEISTNPREKLMIKVDYARQWRGQILQTIPLIKMGVMQQVATNTLNQIIVEKLAAYVGRKSVQSRDMYDVIWLYGQGARLDNEFVQANSLGDLVKKAILRMKEDKITDDMKRKLAPFLFAPGDESKLNMFGDVLKLL